MEVLESVFLEVRCFAAVGCGIGEFRSGPGGGVGVRSVGLGRKTGNQALGLGRGLVIWLPRGCRGEGWRRSREVGGYLFLREWSWVDRVE